MALQPFRLGKLRRDESGIAFVEFAYSLPIFLGLSLAGLEVTNYVTTRMRISQIALHIADHSARLGEGSMLAAKKISEKQINDVLTGAGTQAAALNLYANGRVVLSSLEPVANPNPTDRYRIAWQRCRGSQSYTRQFGVAGDTNLTGIGPTSRRVKAPSGGATMFVEVHYVYKPIIGSDYAPSLTIREIASMTVRDRRDMTQIYNTESVTASSCTT